MNETIVTDLSDQTLTTSIKANLYALFQDMGRAPQTEFFESLALRRWHTGIGHPWFNGVLSLAPPRADEGRTIRDSVSYFKSCNSPIFTWWLAPELDLSGWAKQLERHGFRHDGNTPGMAVDLAALPATVPHPVGLVIEHVETASAMQAWTRTFTAGYELPDSFTAPMYALFSSLGLGLPYRYYLASLEGKPVAASILFLGAGVAGIYCVATVAEARGQGIGAAVTLQPLLEARGMGYRAGILQASDMGFGVYQRLGFKTYCAMDHFFWSAEQ